MEQQKKYQVEEYHRGEWTPLMVKDKNGNKIQKRVIITEDEAEQMNMYSKEYKLRYVLANEKKAAIKNDVSEGSDLSDDKALLTEQYKAKFGKKPFPGWDVEQLKDKINE